MAVIDPEGLFHGDRLKLCSDAARMHWPYLFLAANGYGRFEVNYRKILVAAYDEFKTPPSEEEILGYLEEFRQNNLLFLYQFGSQVWGQWYTKPGTLPKYQTRRDKQSPAPPEEDYRAWLESHKTQSKSFSKPLKTFENLPKTSRNISETFPHGIGVGIGVVVGEGEGEGSAAPSVPASERRPSWSLDETFSPFVVAYLRAKPNVLEEEFTETHHLWCKFQFTDKLRAVDGINKRIEYGIWDDPQYVPSPTKYLQKEWKREVIKPKRNGSGDQSGEYKSTTVII